MKTIEMMQNLCYHDLRNPDRYKGDDEKPTPDCKCDNCFYGRTELAEELLKQQAQLIQANFDIIRLEKRNEKFEKMGE